MSAASSLPITSNWPADVVTFAMQQQLTGSLEPFLEDTRRLFPTATQLDVFLEQDPEIRDHKYLVFEVSVPVQDVPDHVQAMHLWTEQLHRISPASSVLNFRLSLFRVGS